MYMCLMMQLRNFPTFFCCIDKWTFCSFSKIVVVVVVCFFVVAVVIVVVVFAGVVVVVAVVLVVGFVVAPKQ